MRPWRGASAAPPARPPPRPPAGLSAAPARAPGGGGRPAGGGGAPAAGPLARLAEPAARQDQGELDPVQARQHVDLAQLGTPAGGGLLDQPVALALATQHV